MILSADGMPWSRVGALEEWPAKMNIMNAKDRKNTAGIQRSVYAVKNLGRVW